MSLVPRRTADQRSSGGDANRPVRPRARRGVRRPHLQPLPCPVFGPGAGTLPPRSGLNGRSLMAAEGTSRIPEWIEPTSTYKAGEDPLALQTITRDRTTRARLSPTPVARSSAVRRGERSWHRTRLAGEDLDVVVEHERLGAPGQAPLVAGDDGAPVGDLDPGAPDPRGEGPPGVPRRHRVSRMAARASGRSARRPRPPHAPRRRCRCARCAPASDAPTAGSRRGWRARPAGSRCGRQAG